MQINADKKITRNFVPPLAGLRTLPYEISVVRQKASFILSYTIQKTITVVTIVTFLISPSTSLLAEDYPRYIGPGYREYNNGVIRYGTNVVSFTQKSQTVETLINRLNQLSDLADNAYQITEKSSEGILAKEFERKENSQEVNAEILEKRQEREKVADVNIASGFKYVPFSDGKIVYFKDGLPIRTENERVADEFGNVLMKNTFSMQYSDKRLLTSYEASLKDHLGNVTRVFWYGANYSDDSIFYGSDTTSANKNLTEYYLKEIDPAGNVKLTHFNNANYSGKTLQAFNQTIEDNIYGKAELRRFNIKGDSYDEEGMGTDGLAYTLHRDNITKNEKEQETSYSEVKITTALDGGKIKTTTEVKNTYLNVPHIFGPDVEELDADRLLESLVTTTVENPDGSKRAETNTLTNKYAGLNLIGASGHSEFSGQQAEWLDEESQTLQEGSKFKGSSDTEYEMQFGKPMAKQSDSLTSYYSPSGVDLLSKENSTLIYNNGLVNNLPRLLNTNELTNTTYYPLVDLNGLGQMGIKNIATTYTYEPNGNLSKAIGKGAGSGYEFMNNSGWMNYASDIDIDYEVILGEAKQKESRENKDYKFE